MPRLAWASAARAFEALHEEDGFFCVFGGSRLDGEADCCCAGGDEGGGEWGGGEDGTAGACWAVWEGSCVRAGVVRAVWWAFEGW